MLEGMFGRIAPGMCRLSYTGETAIKTTSGYKVYQIKSGRLTNCDHFVFDPGEEFFFLLPTNKVKTGDIILAGGKPKCVIHVEKDLLTVINYEDSLVETLLPEHHVFMGNTYFYGKIVSLFGNGTGNGKKGGKRILQYMMFSEMFKGNKTMLPFLLMGKGMDDNVFEELFSSMDAMDDQEEEEDLVNQTERKED